MFVCKVKLDRDHDNTAYECFFYDRTLAVLPLNMTLLFGCDYDCHQGCPSGVGSNSARIRTRNYSKRMEGPLRQNDTGYELFPYPLVGTYADKFYANRYALIGDAVGMHP